MPAPLFLHRFFFSLLLPVFKVFLFFFSTKNIWRWFDHLPHAQVLSSPFAALMHLQTSSLSPPPTLGGENEQTTLSQLWLLPSSWRFLYLSNNIRRPEAANYGSVISHKIHLFTMSPIMNIPCLEGQFLFFWFSSSSQWGHRGKKKNNNNKIWFSILTGA